MIIVSENEENTEKSEVIEEIEEIADEIKEAIKDGILEAEQEIKEAEKIEELEDKVDEALATAELAIEIASREPEPEIVAESEILESEIEIDEAEILVEESPTDESQTAETNLDGNDENLKVEQEFLIRSKKDMIKFIALSITGFLILIFLLLIGFKSSKENVTNKRATKENPVGGMDEIIPGFSNLGRW